MSALVSETKSVLSKSTCQRRVTRAIRRLSDLLPAYHLKFRQRSDSVAKGGNASEHGPSRSV